VIHLDPARSARNSATSQSETELVATVSIDGPVEVVAIDIPIGLPDAGPRQADDLASAAVGARWPSVFKTLVREALQAPDQVAAIAINRRLAGAGVSAQAFARQQGLSAESSATIVAAEPAMQMWR